MAGTLHERRYQPSQDKSASYPILPRYLDLERFPEVARSQDPLTGLPLHTREVGLIMSEKLTQAIKGDRPFAIVVADVDRLKEANGISYPFGDEYLKWAASRLSQFSERLRLSPGTEDYIFRKQGTGDEFLVAMFGLTGNDLMNLYHHAPELEKPYANGGRMVFSLTTSIISPLTHTLTLQRGLAGTRRSLLEDPSRIAFEQYRTALGLADQEIELKKMTKEQEKLDDPLIVQPRSLAEVTSSAAGIVGGGRSGVDTVQGLLEIQSVQTLREVIERLPPETALTVLSQLGVTNEELKRVSNREEYEVFFDRVFRRARRNGKTSG